MRVKEISPHRMRLRPPLIWSPKTPAAAQDAPEVVWKVERLDHARSVKTDVSPEPQTKKERFDELVEPLFLLAA